MGTSVDKVVVELIARVDRHDRIINASAANFDKKMGAIGASATRMQRTTGAAFNGLKIAAAGFIASIGISTVTRAISAGLDYASSLGEVAQQLGVTTHALQFYRFVGTQVGISQEEIDSGLQKLTRSLGDAAQGAKPPKDALLALGFSLKEIESGTLSAEVAIPRIADGLAKIESPAKRAALEVDLFGRAGQRLDTLLAGGSGQINALADAYKRLGLELTPQQIKNADDAADKLSAVKQVLEARLAGVVADNAQDIIEVANALARLAESAIKAIAEYSKFQRLATAQRGLISDANRRIDSMAGSPELKTEAKRRARQIILNRTSDEVQSFGVFGSVRRLKDKSTKGAGGAIGTGGALALAGLDFGAIIDQLAQAPREVDKFTSATQRARAAQKGLNDDADFLIESLVQANRLALLRAEGHDQEADDIEAIARATEDVNSIEGLTVKQRQDLLKVTRELTTEGLRQVEIATKMLRAEEKFQDELAQRVGQQSEAITNAITQNVNDELDDYTERGLRAQRDLADTFENLFSNGVDGIWRQFKYEGIRAISEVLAQLILPSSTSSGGGGLLGSLVGAVGKLFGGAPKFDIAAANATVASIGRASGGAVSAGQLYRVNEAGVEGFLPAQSGTIIPLGQMPKLASPAAASQPAIVRIMVDEGAMFVPRVQAISGDVSVQVVRAAAPEMVKAASAETSRQFSRPRL